MITYPLSGGRDSIWYARVARLQCLVVRREDAVDLNVAVSALCGMLFAAVWWSVHLASGRDGYAIVDGQSL